MIPDTAPIRSEEAFDEEAVAEYLRAVLPDLAAATPIEFAQFPEGKANLTYLARAGSAEFVLRRPPLGPVAPGSHDMAREYRVLSVLHRRYPLAPRAVHLCEDETILGKPFLVMERRRGWVIRRAWPIGLENSTSMRRSIAESLFDALAALHAVDFGELGLSDLGRPEGFAERQVRGWTDRWARAAEDPVPAMDELAMALAASVPAPQRATLLHNDWKLNNAMVGAGGSLVAVLDWDMATTGDPLIDLGTAISYWEGQPEFAGVDDPPASLMLEGAMSIDEIIHRYCAATGLSPSRLDWYRSFASFRIAVIAQQIFARFVRGQTRDERFAGFGSVIEPIARRGLEALGATG